MICAGSLAEAGSRHDANSGVLQKLEGIEHVGSLADRLGLFHGLGWKMNLKKNELD